MKIKEKVLKEIIWELNEAGELQGRYFLYYPQVEEVIDKTLTEVGKVIDDVSNEFSKENKKEVEKSEPSKFNLKIYEAFESFIQGFKHRLKQKLEIK